MRQYYILLVTLVTFSFSQAQIVNIPDANFKNALVNDNVVDTDFDGWGDSNMDTNNDGEIQVAEAEAVTHLIISPAPTPSNIASITGIESFVNLIALDFSNHPLITDLDMSGHLLLEDMTFKSNDGLVNLNISSNVNLKYLTTSWTALTSIDLSNHINLVNFNSFQNNQLTSLDFSNNLNLAALTLEYNSGLTLLDLSNNTNLNFVNFLGNNLLTSLDLSNAKATSIHIYNSELTSLFMKNGFSSVSSQLDFYNSPNLIYICVDEDELTEVQTKIDSYGYSNCVVNSYCSFVPGGDFYTIEGDTKLDIDVNGCDVSDPVYPNLKFNIDDGTINGVVIANITGNFSLPVSSGLYTVTPELENLPYFTVIPPSIIVDFPSDASPYNQDFCITPSGTFNDLEISVLPINQARPGFDTDYRIVYKNKGTTTLSGNVNFIFNDDLMDLVSASPTVDVQTTGSLTWNYTSLQPFETRSIDFTMNINTPTDPTYPVIGDDILSFIATINPLTGDETPEDNVLELHQTVVNAYDPNDKTCLEGATIAPSEVGAYVHYMIRFENTGTASAINIVVKDIIDIAKYDISTLIPLHGSHSYVTRIRDTNTVEFIFENINLPFDDANNDGYVSFKIKTQPSLVVNDTFENNAEIYFDYNAPIITNIAQTTVAVLGLADFEMDNSIGMHPNPAKEAVYIQGKNNLKEITFFDINGRVLKSISVIGTQTEKILDITKLTQGIYFIRVVSNKGQFVSKLVKE